MTTYFTTRSVVIDGKAYKAGQVIDGDTRPGVIESCLHMGHIAPTSTPKAPAANAESGEEVAMPPRRSRKKQA